MERNRSFEAKELSSPDRTVAGSGKVNRTTTSVAAHEAALAYSMACAEQATKSSRERALPRK